MMKKAGHLPSLGSRGFTLLELLVAITLTFTLLTSLYFTFLSVLRTRSMIEVELERMSGISRFLDIFSSEVRSAFYREKNHKSGFSGENDETGGRILSALTFTRFAYRAPLEGNSSGDLVRVRYAVDENNAGGLILYKEVWNPYRDVKDGESLRTEVIDGVDGFEVSYFNGRDWVKVWEADLEKRLPDAVKVTLSVRTGAEVRDFKALARPMIR
jgi:general secretion pathway protein J